MHTMTEPAELISAPEAGRRLGISTRDVYALVDADELPAVVTSHGLRIAVDDVEQRRTA